MKIFYLLLCILSFTSAKVLPRTGANDVFDGVEGVIYDIPEYEDPEVSLFKLISRGVMPVVIRGSPGSSVKDDKPIYQTDDIKKGLDTVITQLQEAKNKLESGNNAIYLDIDKAVISMENLKEHLYFDIHAIVPTKQPATPDIENDGPTTETPVDRYRIVKASIKKYLSPIYPLNKYFSMNTPTEKSSSPMFLHSSFDDVAPYLSSKVSVKQSPADNFYAEQSFESVSVKDENLSSSTAQPLSGANSDPSYSDGKIAFETAFSKEENLPSPTAVPLKVGSSTEEPAVIEKSVHEFKFIGPTIPPSAMIPYVKEVKSGKVDGDSPVEPDQEEQGDKTLIRKKWTWKISSELPTKK